MIAHEHHPLLQQTPCRVCHHQQWTVEEPVWTPDETASQLMRVPEVKLRAPNERVVEVWVARVQPYPFVGNPPPLPLPPRPSEPAEPGFPSIWKFADFDGTRSRHLNWTNGPDGAVWWHDKREQARSSLSALSNDGFRTEEAVGIFSQADLCIYMTKAKGLSPGQVGFQILEQENIVKCLRKPASRKCSRCSTTKPSEF